MKLFFLLFFFVPKASADFSEDFTRDLKSTYQYESPRTVLITGSLLTLMTITFDDQLIDATQTETVQDKPLGKYSQYGDIWGQLFPNILYATSYAIYGWNTENQLALSKSLLMVKATAYASLVTTGFKYIVGERRPCQGCDHHSFPSGHATSAFAFAGVIIGLDYPWYYDAVAVAVGTFTAFSRINDNKHYVDDVVAGATIGLAFGLGMSHVFSEQHPEKSSLKFEVLPLEDGFFALTQFTF